ncbi:hypothetical protein AMECASPLE_035816 [Ameca splendens]|uniref:Uncharacterized protein n=1 Tax=Ameca splendens TaxID=208324 RepID=A0ABV0XKH0_9TELE
MVKYMRVNDQPNEKRCGKHRTLEDHMNEKDREREWSGVQWLGLTGIDKLGWALARANSGRRSRGAGSYDEAGRGNADVEEMAANSQQDDRFEG